MAAKLILTAFIAALGVNGSPCKPNSSASLSPDFTSHAVPTTTTDDDVSNGSGFPTQSSVYEFTSTTLASTLATDETTSVTLEASSSDKSSLETLASETTWDGSSATTIPTSFTTTESIVDESTTLDSAVVASWSSDSTTSSITSTTTTAEAQIPIGLYNGGFEDDPSPDALPWVIGRSVTIPNDPGNARSGNRYALVKFPITGTGRPIYPLQQTITGLDTTKTYMLTIHWAFTDFGTLSNTACEFWTYFGPLIEYYRFNAAGMPTNEYSRRQYLSRVSDSVRMILYWRCTNSVPTSPWDGAEIRIDDVALVEYDPPCTLVKSPPQGLTCGQIGTFPTSANSYLIGSEIPLGPFENCVQMCAENPDCKTITGAWANGDVIGRNARCKLYSRTPEELGFTASTGGPGVFQPDCFECRPSE
ncbi:hypothetical protein FPOA_02178 [Fusarium poae]|uniref:Apple domain-containing protein n=1 Tax=Fusarium poae TaxID=36050 RepID=A0A1B8B687_FUSPO|nr:hypothetical protein FPOA_02178 [Fusarium poae]